MKNAGKWIRSVAVGVVIFTVIAIYQYLNLGVFSSYTAGKSFAGTAVVLAGITLILGPLAQRFRIFVYWAGRKRQLGLSAFGCAMAHVLITIFLLGGRFDFSWYLMKKIPIGAGIIGLAIWMFLAYLSRDSKVLQFGFPRWKRYHSWGARIAFLAIYTHIIVLKYESWKMWYGQISEQEEFIYPPANLVIILFMTAIIIAKIILMLLPKRGK
jgi:hypothetical protein